MSDPRTIRTNNPGAIEYGPFAQRYGATGSDGRYAVFPDTETGYRAMDGLLGVYRDKHGLNTVSGIVNRWAPRNVDNNSTDLYTKRVAEWVGVDPNAPLGPEHFQKLPEAMARYEAGMPVPRSSAESSARAFPPQMKLGLSPTPQAPRSMDTTEQKPFSLSGLLAQKLSNPLFLMGAGIYSAGSQGKDIGSGLLMGSQAAQQAGQAQMQQEEMRRKLAAKQAQDKLWQGLDTNPALTSMTPEQRQMIKALGPETGGTLLTELIKSQITPKNQYDFKAAGENLWRVNPKTGQAEPVGSAVRPTSDQLNFKAAQEQGYRGSFNDWLLEQKRAGATAVTTDMRGENAESKARGEGLGKRLNGIADDGVEADKDMAILSRITALQGNVEPGTKTALMEEIRAATGITLDPNTDNVQAFKAAANYLVPRMRVPGSGASSDRDVAIFQRSLPSLLGTPGGNELVTETLGGLAQHRKDRAEIAAQWQRGEITAAEADKKMRSLPDPFATFKKAVGDQRFGAPAGKATGNENLPRPKTPQEAMRLPSGTKFIDADGNVRTRP